MFNRIVVILALWAAPVMAEAAISEVTTDNAVVDEAKKPNDIAAVSQINELISDVDIKLLTTEMSESEKMQSSDVFAADDNEMSELQCEDERLKKQVVDFIFHTISKNPTNSVLENRSRVLLVRNMNDFHETDPDKISSRESYITATSLAFLKIKKQRKIYRVCVSRDNKTRGFDDVYAIIYPFAGYYKVAVTNLAPSSQALDEKATFIFSW